MAGPWPSEADIHTSADLLAQKFFELMVHTNPFGAETAHNWLATNKPMFHQRSESFITLDPQKIIDEMERVQSAASAVAYDLSEEFRAAMRQARDHLSDWLGPAADAFRQQLTHIEAFTNRHSDLITRSVGALGASVAVATHVRRDYLELADNTVSAIDKVIRDGEQSGAAFALKIGGGIAKTVIGALADPRTALATVAQGVIDFAVETVDYGIKGADFNEVLGSYVHEEDRLRRDYEAELDAISHSLRLADGDLADEAFSMYRPLPSNTDVDSPDFRYEHFFTKERLPDDEFNQRVENERERMAAGGSASSDISTSAVRRRLAPEEDR
ncbi:hypothetical protein [Actinokineospora fastidiosa]|uniref:Uncharacterized protein n=1 Tax=Actinokineospora fastidiosa TaxID=1816 RepID=A0A918G3Z0_9PSEU|nr:hypothetical protein [Actinokineospora fastidiosa]GGS16023.1 hypothetical protein GCM10010171_05200 [Actinokineospora fastidiosa]